VATITLYLINTYKAYMMSEQGRGWSLVPDEGESTYYGREILEEAEFILPDGCRLDEDNTGSPAIYRGYEHCPLTTGRNGRPYLCASGDVLPLKRACV
jgi:hypothetical protein